jgi:hypothetical protein
MIEATWQRMLPALSVLAPFYCDLKQRPLFDADLGLIVD